MENSKIDGYEVHFLSETGVLIDPAGIISKVPEPDGSTTIQYNFNHKSASMPYYPSTPVTSNIPILLALGLL